MRTKYTGTIQFCITCYKKETMNRILLFLLPVGFVLFGCQTGYNESESMQSYDMDIKEEMIPVTFQSDVPPPPPLASENGGFQKEALHGNMLIKNVQIGIEVDCYEAAYMKVDSLVKVHKGWISTENYHNSDYQILNFISIRVPSASLDGLVEDFIQIAKKVEYQRVESNDVTAEYIDVESRLKNLRKVENTFVRLLRKTDSIEDILKIESKLAEVRGNIESIEGRLKYLKNRVQFSTIELNVYQKIDFKYAPEPSERFVERLKKSLHNGWKGFVSFLLFVIAIWPLYIIVGVTGFLIAYYRKKKKVEKPVKLTKKEKKKLKKQHKLDKKETEDNQVI